MPYRSSHEGLGSGSGSRSSSSCAACKLLKRRCGPSCVFAPYFRSDEPKKFAKVHKVFGASNVSKILGEVPEEQREDTVNSLAYEAEARLRDPVYGCIGAIAILQRKMAELQHDLAIARARLARAAAAAASNSLGPSGGQEEYYDHAHLVVNNNVGEFGDIGYYSCTGGAVSFNNEGFSQGWLDWGQEFGIGANDCFGNTPFM